MNHLIAPSLLSANFLKLEEDMQMINNSKADWLHVDVMDGNFVPNISFGFSIIKQVKSVCTKPLDVHLMINQPEKYIEQFREAGADHITVHYEACPHLHRVVQQIKSTGATAGVALNPHTPVTVLQDILEDLDLVLLMSVNPGFGGQKFIYRTIPKLRQLNDMKIVQNASTLIEIDGGVGLQNAQELLKAGANVLVSGSAVFKEKDPNDVITKLKEVGRDTIFV